MFKSFIETEHDRVMTEVKLSKHYISVSDYFLCIIRRVKIKILSKVSYFSLFDSGYLMQLKFYYNIFILYVYYIHTHTTYIRLINV